MNYKCRNNEPRLVRRQFDDSLCVGEYWYPPGHQQRRHAHDCPGVSIVLHGSLREQVGRCDETARSLSLVVKPARIPHSNQVGPEGATLLQISFRPTAPWIDSSLRKWHWRHSGHTLKATVELIRSLRSDSEMTGTRDAIFDLLGELGTEPILSCRTPRWLLRARNAIDESGLEGEPQPGTIELARNAGVHPVSLSRAFRRHYGVSLAHYRRLVRIRCAVRASSKCRKLVDIAADAGYSDQAHFCRDARALAGVTPGELCGLFGRT